MGLVVAAGTSAWKETSELEAIETDSEEIRVGNPIVVDRISSGSNLGGCVPLVQLVGRGLRVQRGEAPERT